MARVNLLKQIKTDDGWRRVGLRRNSKGRIVWETRPGTYLIEWREDGKRLRQSAGTTPSEALEAQKRKRLELEAAESGLEISLPEEVVSLSISKGVDTFVDEIKTFCWGMMRPQFRVISHVHSMDQKTSCTPRARLRADAQLPPGRTMEPQT